MINFKKSYIFRWKGISPTGMRCSGKRMGTHKEAVEKELRKEQITPLTIKISNQFQLGFIQKNISTKYIIQFTQQLSLLIKKGFSLQKSLMIIAKGQSGTKMQNLIQILCTALESGESFTHALQKFPKQFDSVYCSLINAGENAGTLTISLDYLSNDLKRAKKLNSKIYKAMLYPLTVFCTAVFISIGLLLYVVPQFYNIFNDFNAKLPWLTTVIISISGKLERNSLFILSIVIMMIVSAYFITRKPQWQRLWHRALLKIPLIKKIIITTMIARWARVLAMTISTGIPLLNSLKYAEDSIKNIAIKETMQPLREEVKEGKSLAHALQFKLHFPQQAWSMMAVGEESGTLGVTLLEITDIYTEHVDNLLDSLSKLVEPVIILLVAILMGGLILAMYLPIFKLGSVI